MPRSDIRITIISNTDTCSIELKYRPEINVHISENAYITYTAPVIKADPQSVSRLRACPELSYAVALVKVKVS